MNIRGLQEGDTITLFEHTYDEPTWYSSDEEVKIEVHIEDGFWFGRSTSRGHAHVITEEDVNLNFTAMQEDLQALLHEAENILKEVRGDE